MKIRILDQAKLDLLDGFEFYEQKEESLGDYFLDSLYSDIDSLALYAGVHAVRHGFYWVLSKRFPYAIHYSIEENVVHVHAVLDCRSDPKFIEKRLESERTRRWTE
jgi:hypothetical protein